MKLKPDVIFIGYMKAGSTFLRSYFSYHPDIYYTRNAGLFLAKDFELKKDYYLSLSNPDKNYKCYIDMYEGVAISMLQSIKNLNSKIRFQPYYHIDKKYIDPDVEKIARRIYSTLPNSKILIIIRNQIDWLRSYYLHYMVNLSERSRSLGDFLNTFDGKCGIYSALFHITIEAYYEVFGKDNVHVMLLEQIIKERKNAEKNLCNFLEVEHLNFPKEKQKVNKGKSYAEGNILKTLSAIRIPDKVVKKLSTFLKPMERMFYRFYDRDVLTPNEKSLIRSFYSVSNYHTSNLIDLDLKKYGYPM